MIELKEKYIVLIKQQESTLLDLKAVGTKGVSQLDMLNIFSSVQDRNQSNIHKDSD